MTPELLIAIAALCGNPTQYRLAEQEVLQCQQYYIKCVLETKHSYPNKLASCVLEKKQMGGSK